MDNRRPERMLYIGPTAPLYDIQDNVGLLRYNHNRVVEIPKSTLSTLCTASWNNLILGVGPFYDYA